MSYKLQKQHGEQASIYCSIHDHYIPLDPANRHYQQMLDEINEQGAVCFDGDIPAEIQSAADSKLFAQQLEAFKDATARLAKYELSKGRPELTQSLPTGEKVFDEATGEMVDVMADVVTPAVEPLPATVEVTEYAGDGSSVTKEIRNPTIVQDEAERAAAQAVINSTPAEVVGAA